ncbi:laminin subunit alpha-3 [Trichomycterus rosablanca]|uniref:laminin subunit alpha-3 n=1 Tax=Trichomycterus rosablanca TaxID=2290929 RepID=UPI002F356983
MAWSSRGAAWIFLHAWVRFCVLDVPEVLSEDPGGFSLTPPYFNLAEGAAVSATATCGQDESGAPRSDLYCKLVGGPTLGFTSQTIQGQYCDQCNANIPDKSHPVSNAVDGTERWWQSPPLSRGLRYNEVNVMLDLGQLFHVAYVIIKFANSPRPDLWVLERSVDHGQTFMAWQYFAHSKKDCIEMFGQQPNSRVVQDDEQICTTEYSRIVPLENGEIVVSLVNGRPGSLNFTYSQALQDFTKATNIRLRFLRTNTLLGHLISKAQRDPTVTRRYYYSIKDISVGGRCVCHGHAQSCGVRVPGSSDQLLCECQHNTCGESCDHCCPGHNQKPWRPATSQSPNECEPCQCHSHAADCYYDPEVERRGASLNIHGSYEGGGICIDCQHNTAGVNCEQCVVGYYRPSGVPPESPTGCIPCRCDSRTSLGCEMGTGRCLCKPQYIGDYCDRCSSGYRDFPQCIPIQITPDPDAGNIVVCPLGFFKAPDCKPCDCERDGTLPEICSTTGRCLCRPEVTGERCDRCRPGYYYFPYCQACLCSQEGSLDRSCDETGQCVCNPGVTGQKCDRCVAPDQDFPHCSDSSGCNLTGSEVGVKDPFTDSCTCQTIVDGSECDHCKPLYWNPDPGNPEGCVECMCDTRGTLSSVGECREESGECFCKPNACSHACDTCKDGYFLLQERNYFGCQGCQCDVGGAIGRGCEEQTGQCQCRKHMRGRTCSEPEPNFYLPDLHHLKFEAEDGVLPNSRPVRFGYDPEEFPHFSWRGYAVLSPAQNEVCVSVHANGIQRPLFHMLLRYSNPSGAGVSGRVCVSRTRGLSGSRESKEVVFPPSPSPSFLTVPGDGFAQPYMFSPGKWTVCVQAEGVLLDYIVLLPSAYYEATILREEITDPCTYHTKSGNCLLYKHVPMEGFQSVLASQGEGGRLQQPTADHPELVSVDSRELRLMLHVPESGSHVLVLEYASEVDAIQSVDVSIGGQPQDQVRTRTSIYSCAYSFLCRSVVVDGQNRVAHFLLPPRAEILLRPSSPSVLPYRLYAVPSNSFNMELVQPKVLCISVHGRFTEDSTHCVQGRFHTPPTAIVVDASSVTRPSGFAPQMLGRCSGPLLKSPQTEVELRTQVPQEGRYTFIVHYCQPEHPTFPVEVLLEAGRTWTGQINASFCPSVSGCRSVVIADRRISLDVLRQTLSITLRIPDGKTLSLDYVLVIPEEGYSPDLLTPEALDEAPDFINQCGDPNVYTDPRRDSEFCKSSSRSLVAHYLDGALPCGCHEAGSTGSSCDPMGGQCPCRPHVIGRQCTRCATGYYGFPYCRRCECGRRLCDEVTGECICPPQTVRPACDVCESQTFSYHPLLGCEGCDCSTNGIRPGDKGQCHVTTGQCTCKPRVGGRQCSQCVAGFYRFPDCVPCSCNAGGVTAQICDPDTGRCLCKSKVEGRQCDECREGSFHFDPANPTGCTQCFCFGVTDQCRSSEKRRKKFVDMSSWRLMTDGQNEVPNVLNPLSNTVVADVQELSPAVQQLHWVLPPSYLGDRVSSYGGFLTYQTKSFGLRREGMTPLDKQPDVLLKGEKMTLVYQDPQSPLPDRMYEGRVQLVESNFRHSGTNRPASREDLMRVLARLDAMWIRALYFSNTQRLTVGEVGLEEASSVGTGAPASSVEVCSCPPEYTGDSCQRCAAGLYRDRNGRCVPCACNGLSDSCDESTGRCLDCEYNTAGHHCERCKDGYYGDAAMRTCRICPCPHRQGGNNFAVGCTEVSGQIQCLCKPGYMGQRCESCAPGYYGNPEVYGGSCQPCNCNGNSCSPKTGECTNGQDPKDTSTEGECKECDSCAQTLFNDLEKLDDDLSRIKAQLDALNTSSALRDRLKELEKDIANTKKMVTNYTTTINNLKPKVTELQRDLDGLTQDINQLKRQAEKKSKEAEKAVKNVDNSHKKAKDLHNQTLDMLKKIQDLLKQLKDSSQGGGGVSSGDAAKLLKEAERLVNEMKKRDFKPQQNTAEKELDEAKKLLEYVKNNCTKQFEKNQEAADRIREQLKNHEDKLKDLEKALAEAKDLVQKAKKQNTANSETLNDLQDRIKNLEKEKNNVQNDITMAKQQLKDTENLLKMLHDSKTEFEQLAAQLDGAKTDLTDRVNNISKAAALEGLVKKAEDHAALLNKLADELQKAVQNSSGRADVKDALAAVDAYKNITEAIKAAEEAANKAKEAAEKALNDIIAGDVPKRAKDLKDESNKLNKDAKNAEKDLTKLTDDLKNQQQRLKDAEKKKADLEKDLSKVNTDLKGIQRDDIAKMIDEAKAKAMEANTSASDTMDRLKDINREIDAYKGFNGTGAPSQVNIDSMLNDVENTVKNLSSSFPSLLDKISQVEKLSSELDPNNNISSNILRIKELIEQARDAANRVSVPMKFTGSEHVELRMPRTLEDLRAYTALSLLLQRPLSSGRGDDRRRRRQAAGDDGNRFVLYLGNKDTSKDYLGMALRNNILYFVYKLNGNVNEVQSLDITRSKSEPAYFDRVDLRRIYEDAEVNFTKLFTSSSPDPPERITNSGNPIYNLLDLHPSEAVFYVGGYPDTFTPPAPLNYPKYRGCLELSMLNERFISLYNFKALRPENVTLETPCKRYVPSSAYEYFEGSGYVKAQPDKVPTPITFFQTILSRAKNAVLMYIGNQDGFCSVTLEKGYVVLRGRNKDTMLEPKKSTAQHDLNGELRVALDSRRSKIVVLIKNKEVVSGQCNVQTFDSYYVGGIPNSLRERDNITVAPLKGCVTNMNAANRAPTISEKVGVSRGCSSSLLMARKSEFSPGGSLESPPSDFSLDGDVTISLGFRSTEKDGLLLQNKQANKEVGISMVNGYVILTYQNSLWRSKKQYQDGQWHYVTVIKKSTTTELRIDEDDVGEDIRQSPDLKFLSDNVVLGGGSLTGCLSNIYLRRPDTIRPEDLSFYTSSGDALVDLCSADRPPENIWASSNSSLSGK